MIAGFSETQGYSRAGRGAICFACFLCALHFAPGIAAQEQQSADDQPGRWQLESIVLADGVVFHGLIQGQAAAEIDFAEIVQPSGKPMYAVIRGIPHNEVKSIERLEEADHAKLVSRFHRFRHRAVIEAGRMEQVVLRNLQGEDVPTLQYDGPWFRLTSTTDYERTRQCVVRIEQMFRAYRTLQPPRIEDPRRLSVVLYGSLDDYRNRLRRLDLSLENAAFYSARERTILAGSDLNLFAERLAQVRREHDETRRTYSRLDAEFARSMSVLNGELKAAGFTEEEAAAEIRQRKATWKAQMEATLTTNAQRQRSNEQKFADVTRQMFARLYHEAFHAYLDTYVYSHDRHRVPRWLNEGLAQVFETGQLDGDSLRIDAPDRGRLARLKADLAAQPLPLAQLLTAREREFLGPHGDTSSQRHYLYAWGLAYHLAFDARMIGTADLDAYVAREAEDADPIARFEKLVGQPLAEFERAWRGAMTAR